MKKCLAAISVLGRLQQSFSVVNISGERPRHRQRGNEIAPGPFDSAGKFEFQKDSSHLPRRSIRQARKFIDRDRRWLQKLGDTGRIIGLRRQMPQIIPCREHLTSLN
jgi:hypothetical protein